MPNQIPKICEKCGKPKMPEGVPYARTGNECTCNLEVNLRGRCKDGVCKLR